MKAKVISMGKQPILQQTAGSIITDAWIKKWEVRFIKKLEKLEAAKKFNTK